MLQTPKGCQEPTFALVPDSRISYGMDAADLAQMYGFNLFPWQRTVLDSWLLETEDGAYAAMTCLLTDPRQNGKNGCIEPRELYGLVVLGEAILHTAHRVDTARKSFGRLASYFENPRNRELVKMVKGIRRTNGQEGIELKNGGIIEFSSRVNGGKRGFDGIDLVVFDEAQELTDPQLESIMSTLAAARSGRRQLIYTGTPRPPESPGTVFERRLKKAKSDWNGRTAVHLWGVDKPIPENATWEDVLPIVYRINPSMGYLIDEDFVKEEFDTMTRAGFSRERLGWWADAKQQIQPVIQRAAWDKLVSEPPEGGIFVYGIKFSPDGSTVALSGCQRPDSGNPFVELIAHEPTDAGVGWLVDFAVERKNKAAQIVVDGKAGASAFVERITKAGISKNIVVQPGTDGITAACAGFLNAVNEGTLNHSGQESLAESVSLTTKRKIGNNGGWGFDTTEYATAEPVESAALAHWQACITKRKPGRKAALW